MKIAVVSHYPLHTMGGVQRFILDFYEKVRRKGIYIRLISPSSPEEFQNEDHISIGKYKVVSGGKYLTNNSTTYYSWVSRKKAKLKEEFDIIHCHEPLLPAFFYGLKIAKNNPGVHIAHSHAMNPVFIKHQKWIVPTFKKVLKAEKYFDQIFASSKYSAVMYQGSNIPLEIVPNGVDTSRLNPEVEIIADYKDGKKNLLFLGRPDPRKGLEYLYKAWPILVRFYGDNIRLIIAGGKNEYEVETMRKMTLGLPKRENIIFEGKVSEERKAKLYRTADVFVSPATGSESFGMVLNEAMACGTPVVAFDNLGYRVVLEEKAEHCIAKLLDVEDLADKIHSLLENDDLSKELSEWGIKEVKEKYDWDMLVDKILAIYDDLIRNSKIN